MLAVFFFLLFLYTTNCSLKTTNTLKVDVKLICFFPFFFSFFALNFFCWGACLCLCIYRAGMTNTTSTSGATTPAPAPALPTYQRSQAALRGPLSQQSQQQQHSNHGMNSSGNNNSVGPFTLASPASVAPPTPHSHAPPSVPPMGKLTQIV